MKNLNGCDVGHQLYEEVRVLPLGGGANLIVCYDDFLSEMQYRRDYFKEDNGNIKWEALEVYSVA